MVDHTQPNQQNTDPRLFLRDEDLDRGVGLLLAAERVLARASEPARKEAGLSRTDLQAMLAIKYDPGRTVSAVRSQLGATVPTFARTLAQLDGRGLVAKNVDRNDGRQRKLSLSPEGDELVKPIADAMRAALRKAYREAGAERVVGARALLEALQP